MLKPKAIAKSSHSGNTTTEYALIGCMICLVSLTGLLSLSGAFSARVSDLKANMQASVSAANAESMRLAAMSSVQNSTDLVNVVNGDLDSDAIDADNSGTVTTGANGIIAGSTINTGHNSTTDSAGVSQKDQNLVANMAKTAFEIAKFQKVLEQLSIYSNGNITRFHNSSVVVDGKKMTARQLAIALGDRGLSKKIENLLKMVDSSGMEEEVKTEVTKISEEVQDEAQVVSETTQEVLIENSDPIQVDKVSNSEKTEKNAGKMCEKAGKKSKDKKCD